MRRWYQKNRAKQIASVRKHDNKIKLWLKEYKTTLKCEICAENHPACLEFHHINPEEKEFTIARIKDHMSWNKLKNEIAKCRVLCANCHRKHHYEEREKERRELSK